MPSSSRRTVVEKGEVGVYHCWNRCVQRAWLCGQDPVTGIDYEYRREVIEEVERQLAGLFAIDIGFHAEQANHLHLILRTRPDLAATYLDDEVRRRWWILVRLKRTGNGRIEEPTAEELERERRRWPDVDVLRQRLADVSWFMGTLCEHLARRFNRESGTSGTFWEHRFGCRSLEDEAAILLCGIYVDLNPIRAGEATVPEEARHTSAYNRIQGMPQRAPPGRWRKAPPVRTTGSVRSRFRKTIPVNSAPCVPNFPGARPTKDSCRSAWKRIWNCSTGRAGRSARSVRARFPRRWHRSWSDWGSRRSTGWRRSEGSTAGSARSSARSLGYARRRSRAGRHWFRGATACATIFA